ncbi:flavin reductase family protein [Shewanella acanthi]|uniref:flavin reductase family protein n=1 Tax=Shewanella acanthi TaxID=2864212 RepID=UPI001C65D477|nr:flavin reductase family protein [Shewanella acanthi]QYJ78851.1 flavin reductase family protein [Shewanella acanthi]
MMQTQFDPTDFRRALGKFPTGVTIVTTKNARGEKIGVTASSFNSVSLDPPLVLWSLKKEARSIDSFGEGKHFAVHVLGDHQQDLSNHFARQGADKFANLPLVEGVAEMPLLTEFSVRFQCVCQHQYDGGDHVILVGRVLQFDTTECNQPLIFHSGNYAKVAHV